MAEIIDFALKLDAITTKAVHTKGQRADESSNILAILEFAHIRALIGL